MGLLRRLFGDRRPEGFDGEFEPGEHAVGSARTDDGHVVLTQFGLWVPSADGHRRIGWHLISKAAWREGVLTVVEAEETGTAGDAVLLADRPEIRFSLPRPGKVPQQIRQRVDGSIRSRYRKDIGGGGAWFVARKVPGRDGTVLQVRADPGVDADLVADIAREAAAKLAPPTG